MENSVHPVSIKTPGNHSGKISGSSGRDSENTGPKGFQDLLRARLGGFKDDETSMEGGVPGKEILNSLEVEAELSAGAGFGDEILACAEEEGAGEYDDSLMIPFGFGFPGITGAGGPSAEEAGKITAGRSPHPGGSALEDLLSRNLTAEEKPAAIKNLMAMDGTESQKNQLAGALREGDFTEEQMQELLSALKHEPEDPSAKAGSKEQEKAVHFFHQDSKGTETGGRVNQSPEGPVSREVLQKNLETFEGEMIKSFETMKEGESSLLKIKLEPENLGKVDIHLRMEDGKLRASIIVENDRIRELFGDRLMELGSRLNQQNIPVDELKMEVAQEVFQAPMNMSHDGRQGQQRHQQKMHYRNKALMKAAELQRSREGRAEGISVLA